MIVKAPPRGSFDYLLEPLRDEVPRPVAPPPPPPEPPRRPQRIHIEIDIRQGPQRPPSGSSSLGGTLLLAILVIGFLALLGGCQAHAQAHTSCTRYTVGGTTYRDCTDAATHSWHGTSYQQNSVTRRTDWQGPNGQTVHCISYKLSFTTYEECDR